MPAIRGNSDCTHMPLEELERLEIVGELEFGGIALTESP
jgi:hypothetical protein